LVAPGGVALLAVPNYGGIYGVLQSWCDAPNLTLHNLEIMHPDALVALVDTSEAAQTRAYPFGRMSPWLVSLEKRMPRTAARMLSLGVNAMGLLQPVTIASLAPLLVLEIQKARVE